MSLVFISNGTAEHSTPACWSATAGTARRQVGTAAGVATTVLAVSLGYGCVTDGGTVRRGVPAMSLGVARHLALRLRLTAAPATSNAFQGSAYI